MSKPNWLTLSDEEKTEHITDLCRVGVSKYNLKDFFENVNTYQIEKHIYGKGITIKSLRPKVEPKEKIDKAVRIPRAPDKNFTEPPVRDLGSSIPYMDAISSSRKCKWPLWVGKFNSETAMCCGKEKQFSRPYCDEHFSAVNKTISNKDDINA